MTVWIRTLFGFIRGDQNGKLNTVLVFFYLNGRNLVMYLKLFATAVVLSLHMGSFAGKAITKFGGGLPGDSGWERALNWSVGIPGASDQARITKNSTAILTGTASIYELFIPDLNIADDTGFLVLKPGAKLVVSAQRSIRVAWSSSGQIGGIILEDGASITTSGDVELGLTAGAVSSEIKILEGSTLHVGQNLEMGLQHCSGTSSITVDGGTLFVRGALDMKRGARIELLNKGTLILLGDQRELIQSYIRSSRISGGIHLSFDGKNTILSTTSPVPATLGFITA